MFRPTSSIQTRSRFSLTNRVAGILATLFVVAASGMSFADDPWPAFRGPTQDGIATSTRLPTAWGPETNVRWRTELPGKGWSSPVIGDGVIYMTAAIPRDAAQVDNAQGDNAQGETAEADYDLVLLLVDEASGELRKVSKLIEVTTADDPKIHKKNSHASPTPLIAGDAVYVHFGHQGTACVDRAGEIRWVSREHAYPPVHGNGGSPVLVGDALIFTCDGSENPYVLALDAATGKEKWKTPRPIDAPRKFSFATPTVIDSPSGPIVIAPGSDCVLALDPNDGRTLWWARFDGYSVVPKPVVSHSRVLIATGFGPTKLLAIRTDGSGEVTSSHIDWQLDRGVPKTPSLIAHEGLVYLISDDGIAMCLDGESGETVWRERIGGNFSASPILAGDRVYFPSEEGVTTVVKAGRAFEKLATNDLEEAIFASPAVSGDALFIRTEKAIYRIEAK
jgi:outer membrane protein assembly factor BamB